MQDTVDFVVIGAGPAGALSAALLALSGAKVILLDSSIHHSNTMELIPGRARRLYSDLFEKANNKENNGSCLKFLGHDIFETVSLWDTPVPMSASGLFNPYGPSLAINRTEFDHYCRNFAVQSGAILLSNTECKKCELKNSIWEIILEQKKHFSIIKSAFCIQATGSKKTQLLDANRTLTDAQHLMLIARVTNFDPRYCQSFFIERQTDCWWYLIPENSGKAFVGCNLPCPFQHKIHKPTEIFFLQQLHKTRLIHSLFLSPTNVDKVTGKAAGPRIYNKVCGKKWAAVGDSAFISDPLSGHGLEFALASANKAVGLFSLNTTELQIENYENWVNDYGKQQFKSAEYYLNSAPVKDKNIINNIIEMEKARDMYNPLN